MESSNMSDVHIISTGNQTTLEYEPLSSNISEIRLLHLQASSQDEPIKSTLQRSSLKDDPVYIALSYAWGEFIKTKKVLVNEFEVNVTINLESALRHIRAEFGSVVLWVDETFSQAMAGINQNDVSEREEQVRVMNIIYSKAHRVISWLGPDYDGGAAAMRMLRASCKILDSDHPEHEVGWKQGLHWLEDVPELCGTKGDETTIRKAQEAWENIDKLLNRPYWTRIWTFQEMSLARELLLMCGPEYLVFDTPSSLSYIGLNHIKVDNPEYPEWLDYDVFLAKSKVDWERWRRVHQSRLGWSRRDLSTESHIRLGDLVGHCRALTASDPRDKIYGLSGMIESNLRPDYTKPVEEVYIEFARQWISEFDLGLLTLAGIGIHTSPTANLPSWVPDWKAFSESRYPDFHGYENFKACIPFVYMSEEATMPVVSGKQLICIGISIDKIADLESGVKGSKVRELEALVEQIQIVPDIMPYPSHIDRLQALILIFSGGMNGRHWSDKPLDPDPDPNTTEFGDRSYAEIVSAFVFKLCCDQEYLSGKSSEGDIIRSLQFLLGFTPGMDSNSALEAAIFGGGSDAIKDFFRSHLELDSSSSPLEQLFVLGSTTFDDYNSQKEEMLAERRIFYTEKGYIGFGPLGIAKGDVIVVIYGLRVPYALRRVENNYVLVGACYVAGMMFGESIQTKTEEDVVIFEIN